MRVATLRSHSQDLSRFINSRGVAYSVSPTRPCSVSSEIYYEQLVFAIASEARDEQSWCLHPKTAWGGAFLQFFVERGQRINPRFFSAAKSLEPGGSILRLAYLFRWMRVNSWLSLIEHITCVHQHDLGRLLETVNVAVVLYSAHTCSFMYGYAALLHDLVLSIFRSVLITFITCTR